MDKRKNDDDSPIRSWLHYGLIVVLVLVVTLIILGVLNPTIGNIFSNAQVGLTR